MEDDLIDLNIDLNRAIEEKLYNYDGNIRILITNYEENYSNFHTHWVIIIILENLENHREVYDVEDEDEGTSQQVMVANQCIEEGMI